MQELTIAITTNNSRNLWKRYISGITVLVRDERKQQFILVLHTWHNIQNHHK